MDVPSAVVRQDRELEARKSAVTEELMQLRWHWTLDETNPDRVSFMEYGRQVGRSGPTIRENARGWLLLQDHGERPKPTADEARRRAAMGSETQAAAEAVAEARGVPFGQVKQKHYDDVRQVRNTARDLAEEKGTSVEEQVPAAIEREQIKSKVQRSAAESDHEQKVRLAWALIPGEYAKARKALREVLMLARQVGDTLTDEHRDVCIDAGREVRDAADLTIAALEGGQTVDWDAELAKLGGNA